MADNTPFTEIRLRAGDTDRSATWYASQVRNYAKHLNNPSEVWSSDLGKFADRLEVGQMYLFEYDPKWKKDLVYYDQFPLIIMVDPLPNGFSGINLHYLPPMARAALLDKLLPATELKTQSKLSSSWAAVRNFSKFPEVRGSVKKYLTAQAGKMYQVNPHNWKSAIFLPTQKFAGGVGPQRIYRETMKKPERKRKATMGGF